MRSKHPIAPAVLPIAAALAAALGAVTVVPVPTAVAADRGAAHPTALESMVASERAFSALAVEKGMKEAFLTYLAEDGVVFRPTAVNGRKVWAERPAPKATLIWEPAFAEVSTAGDLGYDTGPWELRAAPDSQAFAAGHFISVWRKQADGVWRVVVDLGTSHDKPGSGGVGSGVFAAGPAHAAAARGTVDLRKLDAEYSRAAQARGTAAAFTLFAAPDVRFNTEGLPPLIGPEAAGGALLRTTGSVRLLTGGSGLAASRDLGYTYGIAQRFEPGAQVAADSSIYLHVWRPGPDRKWRIALAVVNPLPKPGQQ